MKSHAIIQNVQVLEYWSTNTEINIEWNAYSDMENINIHKYLRAYYLIKWDIAQAREYMTLAGVEILTPNKHGGMSQVELDRETAKAIYLTSLHNLGVLDIEYDNRGKAKYKCSAVGDLVIRKILKL